MVSATKKELVMKKIFLLLTVIFLAVPCVADEATYSNVEGQLVAEVKTTSRIELTRKGLEDNRAQLLRRIEEMNDDIRKIEALLAECDRLEIP